MNIGKIILVVCDGMGDRPCEEFDGMTPLQAADTPNMDRLAALGQTGLLDIIRPGVTPGSDTAHLSILGYDSEKLYTGRGPFEAAGAGIEVKGGDVAFRCNFGTLVDGLVVDRRAGRIKIGTEELARAIDGMVIEDVQVIFRAGVEHRAALVLRGPGLSPNVTETDAHETGVPTLEARALSPDGEKTARILNTFMDETKIILAKHPVNIARNSAGEKPGNVVLVRGAGIVPTLEPIEKTTGMKVGCIAGVTLVKGVCRAAGLKLAEVKGATGGMDTDMMAKASAALTMLQDCDMVLVNIKAPDLAGHDGNPKEKAAVIGRIDRAVGRIMEGMPDGTVLAVTADHSTPCSFREHTGDPVPLVIYAAGNRCDDSLYFHEKECSRGGLGRLLGMDLLPVLTNMSGRAKKYGA